MTEEIKITERFISPPEVIKTVASSSAQERVEYAIKAYRSLPEGENTMSVSGGCAEAEEVEGREPRTRHACCIWHINDKDYMLLDKEAIVVACAIEAESIMNGRPEEEYSATVQALRTSCKYAHEAMTRDGAGLQ